MGKQTKANTNDKISFARFSERVGDKRHNQKKELMVLRFSQLIDYLNKRDTFAIKRHEERIGLLKLRQLCK